MKTKGSCLCGQVRFEIATTPETYMEHCHCSMCRKAHGASFVTWIDVPTADFAFLGGESEVARFRSSPDWNRAFCRHCGASLFGQRDGSSWISIAAGVLDSDPGCRPSVHLFVASRAPWVTPEAGLLQYDERPPKK